MNYCHGYKREHHETPLPLQKVEEAQSKISEQQKGFSDFMDKVLDVDTFCNDAFSPGFFTSSGPKHYCPECLIRWKEDMEGSKEDECE